MRASLLVLAVAAVCGAVELSRVHAAPLGQPTPTGSPGNFDVFEKSIFELQTAMREGRTTSRALTEQYLARIRAYDQAGPQINAFITLNPRAGETAAALDDERRTKGPRGPLHGIPIVVKDNYATADLPMTGSTVALKGFQPKRDAFQVRKLREAGVVIIGKTNLHELAYGITTISSLGGQTRNPYDPKRNPGGSSGGTGAAIAASFAAAGMGTDTCGSIRLPAAHNNLVGLRGTSGLSSRDGILPLSHTQDVGGPIARNVTDLAVMLDATVGVDPADPDTKNSEGRIPRSYLSALNDVSLATVRVGVLRSYFGTAPEDREVTEVVEQALRIMESLGANVIEVEVPQLQELLQNTSLINAEFKFDLIDFLAEFPHAPVHSLADILRLNAHHGAVDGVIRRAAEVEARDTPATRAIFERRAALSQAVANTLGHRAVHALVYPTIRRKAALIGENQAGSNCQLSAATGFPAISVPAGFTADGLPVGVELLGLPFTEPALLKITYAYERVANFRRPPPSTPPLK